MFKQYAIKTIFMVSIAIYILFSFFIFNQILGFQNNYYANIFFHLHFFLFGILIGYMKLKSIIFFNFPIIIICIGCLIYFIDIQSYVDIIFDKNRIIFSTITLLFIGCFTFNDWLPKILQSTIESFSDLTYSMYLLHFFVFYNVLGYEKMYIMMPTTISLAILTYYLYETKFILLGIKYD